MVLCPLLALEEAHALVEGIPGGVAGEILQQQRHTAEGPVGQIRLRAGDGLLVQRRDDGVELGVERFDAPDCRLDELRG